MLDRRLSRRGKKMRDVALLGRHCDPYPPEERSQRLTRILIEVLAKHYYPLHIITTSSLVLRDIDLIREVDELSWVTLSVVMPGISRKTLKSVQPDHPPPDKRIETLIRFKRSGVQTGIIFNGLYPGVNDHHHELEQLFEKAAELKIDYILFPMPIFENAMYYFSEYRVDIKTGLPVVSAHELRTKEFCDYIRRIQDLIYSLSILYRVPLRMKRYIPSDYRRENYWLAQRLADMGYIRKLQGRSSVHYFKAARRINNLGSDIRNLIGQDEFEGILVNDCEVRAEIDDLLSGRWGRIDTAES